MPETVDQLAHKAAALLNRTPPEPGIAAYRALLATDPDRPDDWYNLGWLLRRSGRFAEALEAYGEALARGVSDPQEVHLNRAVVLSDGLRQPERAFGELRQALAIQPDYVPALLNIGNLHEERGERAEARSAYERAVAAQPDNPLAMMRLAEVSRFGAADDPLLGRIAARLGQTDLVPLERADLGFALGRGLDQAGAYDDAFAAYARANEASAAAGGRNYLAPVHESFVDRIIACFATTEPCASAVDAPIFICGMFRSGSTLAERMLGAHPRITAGGELDLVPMMVARDLQPYPQSLAATDTDRVSQLRDLYLAGLAEIGLQARGLTDKRPDNFLHIGLIKRMFPNAKIVNTLRDPLDNCLSAYFAHLDPGMAYAQSLEALGHWYRQYQRLMVHWRALYPHDIYDLDYDLLVRDPKPHVEDLLAFLDLEWEDSCLEPHLGGGHVRTASAWQVREPLYTSSSGRWRHYDRHLAPLRQSLGL